MRIEVTEEDIRLGQESIRADQTRTDHCAIARALTRAAGVPSSWGYVTGIVGGFSLGNKVVVVSEDEEKKVLTFVIDHDELRPVQPFSFVVHSENA